MKIVTKKARHIGHYFKNQILTGCKRINYCVIFLLQKNKFAKNGIIFNCIIKRLTILEAYINELQRNGA